jgi:D-alanyl-D-alanine carboxypeptidase
MQENRSFDEYFGTFPGADGIKTGWTNPAGKCYVGSATYGGWRLITVVLKSADYVEDTRTLMKFGFNKFRPQVVAQAGEESGVCPVLAGEKGTREFAGNPMEMDKDAVANQKRTNYLTLIPITLLTLKEKEYKMEAIAEGYARSHQLSEILRRVRSGDQEIRGSGPAMQFIAVAFCAGSARQIFTKNAKSKQLCSAKQGNDGSQKRKARQTSCCEIDHQHINEYAQPKGGHYKTNPARDTQRQGAVPDKN